MPKVILVVNAKHGLTEAQHIAKELQNFIDKNQDSESLIHYWHSSNELKNASLISIDVFSERFNENKSQYKFDHIFPITISEEQTTPELN